MRTAKELSAHKTHTVPEMGGETWGFVREIFGFLGFLVILVLVCLMIGVVVGFLLAVNF
jgi:hypothetical protein